MKVLWQMLPAAIKGIVSVGAFLISIGWIAFLSVHSIVKAESSAIRQEFDGKRLIDLHHIDKRFDETQAMIKELKK